VAPAAMVARAQCDAMSVAACSTTFGECTMSAGVDMAAVCACYPPLIGCYDGCGALFDSSRKAVIDSCNMLPNCSGSCMGGGGGGGDGGTGGNGGTGGTSGEPTPAPTPRSQSGIRSDLRVGLYPALAIVSSIVLFVFVCLAVGFGKLLGAAGIVLIVLGVVQALLGVFWLFYADALAMLQFFYAALFTIYAGVHAHRLRLVQLLTVVALVNFLCLTGNFAPLGWGTPPFDMDFNAQQGRCQSQFMVPDPVEPSPPTPPTPAPPPVPPVPPTPPTVCHEYLNVLQAFGYTMTVVQPFVIVFSFAAWQNAV